MSESAATVNRLREYANTRGAIPPKARKLCHEAADLIEEAFPTTTSQELQMTPEELITKQQLEIEQLKQHMWDQNAVMSKVHVIIYGVGAPLNDNRLHYTADQKRDFQRIADALGLN